MLSRLSDALASGDFPKGPGRGWRHGDEG
jgi:hypothetical protein